MSINKKISLGVLIITLVIGFVSTNKAFARGGEDGNVPIESPQPSINLKSETYTYDGTPKPITIINTIPSSDEVEVRVTYNGSENIPIEVGVYQVVVTLIQNRQEPEIIATASGDTLTIIAPPAPEIPEEPVVVEEPKVTRRTGGGGGGGYINPSTLNQIAIETTTNAVEETAVLGVEKFNFTLLLKIGSKGNEVLELQKFLNNAGYDCGTADGKFGQKTKNAVIKFQKANNLIGDGVVGAITRKALNK